MDKRKKAQKSNDVRISELQKFIEWQHHRHQFETLALVDYLEQKFPEDFKDGDLFQRMAKKLTPPPVVEPGKEELTPDLVEPIEGITAIVESVSTTPTDAVVIL